VVAQATSLNSSSAIQEAKMNGVSLSGISTNFNMPTLPSNPTLQDTLNFEKAMMLLGAAIRAAETGIETIGNAMIHATNTTPQP
jgi:hypothetical protein